MATVTERLAAVYLVTLAKYEAAMAASGPTYTVPGGATLDRMKHIADLQSQLESLEKKPGVVPEVKPVFTVRSVVR